MEFRKIASLFDTAFDDKDLPRFVTKRCIEVYNVNKEIRIKKQMLTSDLCDFSDAYTVLKGNIIATNPENTKRNKSVAFKNNAPFINCISKINGTLIDNAEDLDAAMSLYKLFEYSKS